MKSVQLFAVLLLPILFGGMIARPFHPFRGVAGFLASGTVAGFTLFVSLAYLFALIYGKINSMVIVIALLVMGVCSLFVCRFFHDDERIFMYEPMDPLKVRLYCLALLGILSCILIFCMTEVLHIDENGYSIGFEKNLGDLPLHLHFISSFLYGDNIPPMNPVYSGVPLRYPFLSDFYSALLWFATGDVEWALELPGHCLGVSLIILLYQWTRRLTGSFWAGILAPYLLFLSGGQGFWLWVRGAMSGQASVLAHSYTVYPQEGFHWANTLYALFIPQRSMQFALPLFIFLVACMQENNGKYRNRIFLFLGLLSATLPFIHGHLVVPLMVYGLAIFFKRPSWNWLYLIIPLALFWTPQILYLAQILGPEVEGSKGFVSIQIGWEAKGMTILWFWLKNTGPYIPIVFAGLFFMKNVPDGVRLLTWASLLVFILGNTILFAPWSWDNIKILLFWFTGSLPMVSLLLSGWIESRKTVLISISLLCIGLLIFSGSLDLVRALKKGGENHRILSLYDIQMAEWIRENTPHDAIFLCQPTYDQPLVLTGRGMVLGYPGHIWSHGLPLEPRQRDVTDMARGGSGSLSLMKGYGITHILTGQRERANEDFNVEFMESKMPLLYSSPHFSIFETCLY
ncbi:MAG: hypothetical protein JXL81_10640 [Deltaproteobacteria bacterium]|nr:hypothetical protein [Deltaproteobacteria bacterium]